MILRIKLRIKERIPALQFTCVLLIVVHAVAAIDAEQAAASQRAGPVNVPVVLRVHLDPSSFLAIRHHDTLVQIRAKRDFHRPSRGVVNWEFCKRLSQMTLIDQTLLASSWKFL